MGRFTVLCFLEAKNKSFEASLGMLQSGRRKLHFKVEANERLSCNRWAIRLCLRREGRQEQAICPLLFPVARKMSALPSDKEGLQPRPCQA